MRMNSLLKRSFAGNSARFSFLSVSLYGTREQKKKKKKKKKIGVFLQFTDEGSLPEIVQYSPYYLPLNVLIVSKGSNLYILSLYGTMRTINVNYLLHI